MTRMRRTLIDPVLKTSARRLRRDSTVAEQKLWRALRASALGVRFRRQHAIGADIADFACVEAMLVVEVDGGQHGGKADAERDGRMRDAGWRVARYWNNDVLDNLDSVVADLARLVGEKKQR
jgi:primosomal protein N' (replication factor Y)